MKKRKFIRIVSLFIVVLCVDVFFHRICFYETQEEFYATTDNIGKLEIHFFDVGQGDATLLIQDGHTMLVDGGDNLHAWQLQSNLMYLGIEHLDYIIATHPDVDHIGGLDVILEHFSCAQVLMPDCEKDTYSYREFVTAMEERGIQPVIPEVGDKYDLGNAQFTIQAPNETYEEPNDNSIAFLLEHGKNRFLFTGDAEQESEKDMLKNRSKLKADLYKVAHHGSRSSSTELFLLAVKPEYAVISCGEENDHGHPHSSVLNRLRLLGVKVFRTDEQGTIVAISDGEKITFNMSPSDSWQAGD